MGYRYDLDERIFGGSHVPRFNPEFGGERINAKLGPRRTSPMVRSGDVHEEGNAQRRRLIGLPSRFDRE